MRRLPFTFFLCGALCAAGAARCYAAEVINIPDRADIVVNEDGTVDVYEYDNSPPESEGFSSVSDNDVASDVLTSDGLLSILEEFARSAEDSVSDPVPEESDLHDDSVNFGHSVSDNDVGWDVMYFDHVDDQGNNVTSKFTQYQDGATLFVSQEDFNGGLQTLSSYTTYYGLIGSQYLDLFRGLAAKLGINEHYVCARVSQYEYIFAHSDSLRLSGNSFSGSSVRVITYHTNNNGYFSSSVEGTFSLNGQSYIVYSDLGKDYPSLLENHDIYSRTTFFLFGICVIAYFINSFFGKGVVTNALRKSKKREVY